MTGSKNRLEEMITTYTPLVLKLAMGILHNAEDALDISQEVFLQFSTATDVKNQEAWLYRSTINRAINLQKKNRARQQRELDRNKCQSTPVGPAVDLERKEQLLTLQQKIASLPEGQRTIFLLRHQADMPLKEIAHTLQVSEGTVKKQLSRVLHTLRKQFIKEDCYE